MPDYSLSGLDLLARNGRIVSVETVSARGREMPLLQTAASV